MSEVLLSGDTSETGGETQSSGVLRHLGWQAGARPGYHDAQVLTYIHSTRHSILVLYIFKSTFLFSSGLCLSCQA